MTTRKINIKTFIKKASTTPNVLGFLQQYREYLTTGEVASITSPIINKIDKSDLDPIIGLNYITNAVFAHMMAVDLQKAEQSLLVESSNNKPVIARIISSRGEELNTSGFDLHQDAERWVDNRLYASSPGSHGEVIHVNITFKGKPDITIITREDSIARILKKPRSTATKRVGAANSNLKWNMRVKPTQGSFSRG